MALLRNPRLGLLNQENAGAGKRLGLKTGSMKGANGPRVALNDIRNRQVSSNSVRGMENALKPKLSQPIVRKPDVRRPLHDKPVGGGNVRKPFGQKPPITGKVPTKKVEDEPPTKYFAPVLRSRKSHGLSNADTSGHHSENIEDEVVPKRSTRSSAAKHELDGDLISALASCATSSAVKKTPGDHNLSGIAAFSTACNVLPAGVADIDEEDADNPFMVTDYVQDIYVYLRRLELQQSIEENFLVNSGVSGKMRAILVDWMVDVQMRFKLLPETLYMAVGLLDRFLQEVRVTKPTLQLVGATALFVASKYEEIYAPEIADFEYITDSSCDTSTIRQMELRILKTLDFKVGRPLAIHFLRRYSKAADADAIRHTIGKFICEVVLIEYALAHMPPSLIAAAACYISGRLLEVEEEWGPEMVHYSGYELKHFKHVVKPIAEILVKMMYQKSYPHKAVFNKYNSKKFMSVAKEPYFEEANLRRLFFL